MQHPDYDFLDESSISLTFVKSVSVKIKPFLNIDRRDDQSYIHFTSIQEIHFKDEIRIKTIEMQKQLAKRKSKGEEKSSR